MFVLVHRVVMTSSGVVLAVERAMSVSSLFFSSLVVVASSVQQSKPTSRQKGERERVERVSGSRRRMYVWLPFFFRWIASLDIRCVTNIAPRGNSGRFEIYPFA